MNPFFSSFMDELGKLAGEGEDATRFERVVHHPLFQAAGYGSLAGEGAHMLAEHSKYKTLSDAAKSKVGRAVGKGSMIGSTAFLGAEGVAALLQYLRGKKKDNLEKKGEKKAKKQEEPEHEPLSVQQIVTAIQEMAETKLKKASTPAGMRDALLRRMAWGG
jgi:hypothetical protein